MQWNEIRKGRKTEAVYMGYCNFLERRVLILQVRGLGATFINIQLINLRVLSFAPNLLHRLLISLS